MPGRAFFTCERFHLVTDENWSFQQYSATSFINASISKGFWKIAVAFKPAAEQPETALTTTTGMEAHDSLPERAEMNCLPSITGMYRSTIITHGRSELRRCARASAPFEAPTAW